MRLWERQRRRSGRVGRRGHGHSSTRCQRDSMSRGDPSVFGAAATGRPVDGPVPERCAGLGKRANAIRPRQHPLFVGSDEDGSHAETQGQPRPDMQLQVGYALRSLYELVDADPRQVGAVSCGAVIEMAAPEWIACRTFRPSVASVPASWGSGTGVQSQTACS